ncbi:MAG: imidazole glycerol phosphate synthase subunit HisH [Thiotrichaceae bacterium]
MAQSAGERGWDIALQSWVDEAMPLLGICLGMQLLADVGHEVKTTPGLGFIAGEVALLEVSPQERLPHVGWNEVQFQGTDPLFHNILAGNDFYFVHSFHFKVTHQEHILGTTDYGKPFVSAVRRGHVFGVQFHPEKSSRPGFQLLKNFLQFSIS